MKRFLPWIVLVVMAGWIGANWMPPRVAKDDVDPSTALRAGLAKFGKLPVLVGGRAKPLDTVARNSLLIIRGKQELRLENGRTLSAIAWLTDVLFNAPVADQYPAFVVQNDQVLGLFGWEQSQRKYFSFAEFAPFLKQIEEQGDQADKLEAVQRSAYQSAILNLRNALVLYQRLKNSVQLEGSQNFAGELKTYQANVPGAANAAAQAQRGENFDRAKLNDVAELIQKYEKISEMAYILAVPSTDRSGDWHSVGDSLLHSVSTGKITRRSATRIKPATSRHSINMSILPRTGSPRNSRTRANELRSNFCSIAFNRSAKVWRSMCSRSCSPARRGSVGAGR